MAFTTLYHFPQVSHVDAAWISLNDVGKDMQVRKRTWSRYNPDKYRVRFSSILSSVFHHYHIKERKTRVSNLLD